MLRVLSLHLFSLLSKKKKKKNKTNKQKKPKINKQKMYFQNSNFTEKGNFQSKLKILFQVILEHFYWSTHCEIFT